MTTANPQRRVAGAAPAVFATVADGVRAQVVTRALLPPHMSSSAHEGRSAGCPCKPLLDGLTTSQAWVVVPRGAREDCTQEEHSLQPLRVGEWRLAPRALRDQSLGGHVMLVLTMCAFCGAVEVRDTSFHAPAGMARGTLAPRRRSDVLGWYSGKRPAGRIYT